VENICFDPFIRAKQEPDALGNVVTRIVAPGGQYVSADFLIADSGRPDDYAFSASEIPMEGFAKRGNAIFAWFSLLRNGQTFTGRLEPLWL
jgi:hypothetical protein